MQYIYIYKIYTGIKVPGPFDVWFDYNSAIEVSFKQAWKEQLEWILARTQFTGLIRYTPTPSRNSNHSHTDLLQTRSSYSTTLTQVQTSSTAWCCFAEVPKKKTNDFCTTAGFSPAEPISYPPWKQQQASLKIGPKRTFHHPPTIQIFGVFLSMMDQGTILFGVARCETCPGSGAFYHPCETCMGGMGVFAAQWRGTNGEFPSQTIKLYTASFGTSKWMKPCKKCSFF